MAGLKPSLNLFGDFLEISCGLEYEPLRVQSRAPCDGGRADTFGLERSDDLGIDRRLAPAVDAGAVVRVES